MNCPSCAYDLRPGARFCDACGHPVGAARSPARRTHAPAHLAEKILASRGRLEGERKQVTVLFADVKGSMELAERVDPEAWHRILDRFFAILADGVHRFEGTVNQFTGDGIMALFGAPLAHEDHARRACAAALHLRAEIRRYARDLRLGEGLSFSVRMGLNSGDVVVGTIGDDLHMDYTALGTTVGLAQRVEQLAEPGRVYLTEHTARLVEGFFRLEELGPFSVKGVRDRVRVYELEGAGPLRTRLDLSRARGLSRFVGREKETAALEAALRAAVEGHGGVLGIVADAGVGKSRLCYEFIERIRARGVAVHQGHCVPHGRMVPFLPILELLRGYFGISEQDDGEAARRKIAGTVLLLDAELTGSLPLLFDFLAVADPERPAERMDPEARQRRLRALLTRLVQARSRREPNVLLVEDLHWIDGGSATFLEQLVATLPETATLLLVTSRPEYRPEWLRTSCHREATLAPLVPAEIDALLQDLLGSDPSLAGLGALVRERTAGNPFFVEEVVQGLVEGGSLVGTKSAYRLVRPVAELVVPRTVQAVLAARIDRLPQREKDLLQTASVIGKEFTPRLLGRVSERPDDEVATALATLVRAEFIYEDAGHPESEYSFKHPLTHEVAYRSQLGERRAATHAAVARAIAELHADRLDERAALLAHHWEEAGDRLEAARWSRRAARWAAARDLAQAVRQWRKLRELLPGVPDSPEKVQMSLQAGVALLGLGWRLGISEDEASAILDEGVRDARRIGDTDALASLLNTYGTVRGMWGHVAEALERTREATRLADETGDASLQLAARVPLVEAQYVSGDLNAALETLREAGACAARVPNSASPRTGFDASIWIVMMTGWVLFETGHPDNARRELERALRLAREHGETELLGWSHEMTAYVAAFRGEAGGALDHARQALEIAERLGSSFSRTSALDAVGCVHLASRDWAAAASAFEQALAIVRERRTGLHWEPRILAQLAEARLGLGDLEEARASAEDAVRRVRDLGTKVTECRALLTFGRVLLRTEGASARSRVEAALGRALALVTETGAGLYEPQIRLQLAEVARLAGDDDAHRRELSRAQRLLGTMGAPPSVEG
jgi:class 3 adenylate cyclase/tetratricopeptide (TPR) repeat protein